MDDVASKLPDLSALPLAGLADVDLAATLGRVLPDIPVVPVAAFQSAI